jgi:hypothetical protein
MEIIRKMKRERKKERDKTEIGGVNYACLCRETYLHTSFCVLPRYSEYKIHIYVGM